MSVTTTRLLKSILPAACLWTSLRQVEGFSYDETIEQLKKIYQSDGEDDTMEEDDGHGLPSSVPPSIREMADFKTSIEALGSMIWLV